MKARCAYLCATLLILKGKRAMGRQPTTETFPRQMKQVNVSFPNFPQFPAPNLVQSGGEVENLYRFTIQNS